MRVRSTLSAVPAAAAFLLPPAVSANSVCVTVRLVPGNPSQTEARPCVGSGGVPSCRYAEVEPPTLDLAFVGVCVPKP